MTYKGFGGEYIIKLRKSLYLDGSFALEAYCWDDIYQIWDYFNSITINLNFNRNEPTQKDCAYVDSKSLPEIKSLLKEYDLGKPMNQTKQYNGYNYPLYKFNVQKIQSFIDNQ